jgi:hypothetical protein
VLHQSVDDPVKPFNPSVEQVGQMAQGDDGKVFHA